MAKTIINSQVDKLIALVILVLTMAAGYIAVKHVYLERINALNHQITLAKRKQAKIDSILAAEQDLMHQIAQQKSRLRKDQLFLVNSKPATAASELQNFIKNLVARHSRAKISTIKPYPVNEYDDYSETSLEIRLRDVNHEDLQRLLFQIENSTPVIVVKELDILVARRRYKAVTNAPKHKPGLGVTLVVSGFFKGDEA